MGSDLVSQDPAGQRPWAGREPAGAGEEGQRGCTEDAGLAHGDPALSPAGGQGRPAAGDSGRSRGSMINRPGSAGVVAGSREGGEGPAWLFEFSLLGAFLRLLVNSDLPGKRGLAREPCQRSGC